jgi:alkaline phosphatase D
MHAMLMLLCVLLLWAQSIGAATTVAFGSCLRQWQPVPILHTVTSLSPDAFIFAGDNVYTDTGVYFFKDEPERIAEAYRELAARPEYQTLKSSTQLYATWDDHDYGRDNAGAEYTWKQEAKREFLNFFDSFDSAQLRKRPGVYSVHYLGAADSRIQLLLLDTRTFRDPLQHGEPNQECPRSRLVATVDSSTTLLGKAQWRWLAEQIKQPAALRLIVSSIQVIPDSHCYEKWANFPHERTRLIELIRNSGAMHTVLLSGDRHLGEISRLPGTADTFPLYEITASGLNSAGAGKGEHNRYRVTADNVRVDHFGTVRLVMDPAPYVELALHDVEGAVVQQYFIDYASWQPRQPPAPSHIKGSE